MRLAIFQGHAPNCTGCPACSEIAAAILTNPMNPSLITAMGHPDLRALAERELRDIGLSQRLLDAPDPYEPGLARLRSTSGYAGGTERVIATSEHPLLEPPDPYASALEQMRKENR